MTIVLGLFILLMVGALLAPLFGTVGFVVVIGVGMPCVMAWHYYALDLQNREASRQKKNGDG